MGLYRDRVLPHVVNKAMAVKVLRPLRERVTEGLAGEVLEIGFGTGHNLPHLPASVTRLRAVEPSALSVRLAGERIKAAPFPVEVVGLDGERVPLPDASADAVLCTWSLCTIPHPEQALREMARLLKPGGELRFVEHGKAPDASVLAWQHRLTPVQKRVAGGCHLDRDIPALVEAGGFRITAVDRFYVAGEPRAFGSTYLGRAVVA
jgi:ubiquinone/menaquinone biosynthesis C-methylase UbiE